MVLRRAVPSLLCALLTIFLTGCGSGPGIPTHPPIGSLQPSGSVHGGQQPVVGATIQLYTVGTTADGSAATPLLTSAVTSGADGTFTITGLYSCTSATQVYIVATGGNPGLSTTNPDIALMAALGPCSSLTQSTFISINELTTVAAVSALAPYMSSATAIGSSAADASSLANAFTLANEYVDSTTGAAPGNNIPPGYTDPIAELNTLADIVSACINSSGGAAADGSLCGQLFTLSTVIFNPAPTNTINALLNLANNPTLNTAALFALTPPTPAFQPTLTSAPADFQIQLTPPASSGPVLQITPSSLTFPAEVVGASSPLESITITNTGSSPVTISSTTISGATGAGFGISGNSTCYFTLDPGGSCVVYIVATPSQAGAGTGSLLINSSTPSSPQSVPLSITGNGPGNSTASLTPGSLTFNIWGANEDLSVANTGNTPLNISRVGVGNTGGEGDQHRYIVSSSNCVGAIAAGSTCTFAVQNLLQLPLSSYNTLPSAVTGQAYVFDDATTGSGTQTANIVTDSGAYLSQGGAITGSISFASTPVGSAQTSSIQLASISTQYVNGQPTLVTGGSPAASLEISGANPGDFTVSAVTTSVSPDPSSSCPGGTSVCTISVTFTPAASGTRTAKLSLDSGSSSTGQYILLTGTSPAPGPSFTTNASNGIAMASYLPVTSDPKSIGTATVTVTNTGTTTLKLAATLTGPNPSRFTADVSQCQSVAAQATCPVNLTFSAPGIAEYGYGATLVLTDTSSSASASVGIAGTTSYWLPVTSLASPYSFPSQEINTTSAPVSFNVTDTNKYPIGDPITVSLPANSNFTLPSGDSCPANAQSCTLSIAFSPHKTKSVGETLIVTDTATGAVSYSTLYGVGLGPDFTLTSPSAPFGFINFPTTSVGSSQSAVVTITSSGQDPLTISGIGIAGATGTNFTETNNCPATLAPQASCSVNVTFTPSATGLQSATLQITSNAGNSTSTMAMNGTGQ